MTNAELENWVESANDAACLSSGHGEPPALPHIGFSPKILI
jgi:hypothetical protein